MFSKTKRINVFITDESIGVFQPAPNTKKHANCGFLELDKGTVEHGYIIDPEMLLYKLKTLFKQYGIKSKQINLLIHDQNLIIRELKIPKEELQKKSIKSYIENQTGKSIHFPFDEPNISYHIKSEDDHELVVLVLIVDENLMHDYHDVFDRLNIKVVSFDVAPIVLNRLYVKHSEHQNERLMVVSLFDHMLTIHVLEKGLPVFGMIEECEGSADQYYEMIENYIERVANYYKFNITKGIHQISHAAIFNFTDEISEGILEKKIDLEVENLTLEIFNFKNIDAIVDKPKVCYLAYASSILDYQVDQKPFALKLERVNKINVISNYLMVLSFAIFSIVAILYIPFFTSKESINIQQNINNILQQELEVLLEETPATQQYSAVERDYSDAYDFLSDQEYEISSNIEDLLGNINGSLEVLSYHVNTEEKTITMVVSAIDEVELYEYLVTVYEDYGVYEGLEEDSRWMLDQPQRRFISNLLMEVTITYA